MPDWRRTLYTIWFTQFVAIAGFNFVLPFIPYYIQTLGISDVGQVALWAGISTSVTSLALAIMAPIWGSLADRYGRKPMILRATFAGVVILTLMGFVTSVSQLVVLRLFQGVFTGTIAASTTLVASIAPKDHRGSALGSLQMAIFLGTTVGPLLGGLVAEVFGYRQSFWITGGLLLISALGVLFLIKEDFQPAADGVVTSRAAYGQALTMLFGASGLIVAILAARIILRAGTMTPSPVLALLVQSLLPSSSHAALVTGLTSGVSAVGGALGAPIIGNWGDRWGHRRWLIISGLAAALLYLPQAFVPSAPWLVFGQLLSGFAVGGTLSTGMALLAEHTAAGHEGVVFGLDASATGLANAVGPLLGAGVAAAFSLRAPFLLAAAVLAAGTMIVLLRVREASAKAALRFAQDASLK